MLALKESQTATRIIEINNFETQNGVTYITIPLVFKTYGKELHTAPLIVLNRGLLRRKPDKDSENYSKMVGKGKIVDLKKFTVIEFEIPTDNYLTLAFEGYGSFNRTDSQRIIDRAFEELQLPAPYASFRFD
jgi:homoserine O-acetyltransferase